MLSIFAVRPDRNNRGSPASGKKRMCVINMGVRKKPEWFLANVLPNDALTAAPAR